jgi:hypothetical protein
MKLFGKHISNQAILATMATIVSTCALVVSLMQTYYQHKYLHAAAWPHLQMEPYRSERQDSTKNSMTVKLYNKGVGPAIIESVTYQYNSYQGSFQTLLLGGVIAQNEEIVHASIEGATSSRLFSEAIPDIKTRIVYSSVHDQRWEYLTGSEYADGQKTNKLN